MAFDRTQLGKDRCIAQSGRVMLQCRVGIELFAQLTEGLALDKKELGLGDIAARQLFQQ